MTQEWLALAVVAVAAGYLFKKGYLQYVAVPFSKYLLRHKKVSLAMKVRAGVKKSGCGGDCSCD